MEVEFKNLESNRLRHGSRLSITRYVGIPFNSIPTTAFRKLSTITGDLSHDTLAFERLRTKAMDTKAMDMVKNIKHRTTNALQV